MSHDTKTIHSQIIGKIHATAILSRIGFLFTQLTKILSGLSAQGLTAIYLDNLYHLKKNGLKEFIGYTEIKSTNERFFSKEQKMITKSELLKQVKRDIQALVPGVEITLYGSRAKDTADIDSDWDFLILLPSSVDKNLALQIKDRLYDIELETDTVLSSIIRSKKEWMSSRYAVMPLRQQVESYGIAV